MNRTTLLFVILTATLFGALLYWKAAAWWRRLVMIRRFRRGRQGEQGAPAVLEAAGYHVLEEQPSLEATLVVDGTPRPYTLRADYLVSRKDQRYVAEVKTGRVAPDPLHAATRRQILEYLTCYPVEGVLLVDMESRTVRQIAFPGVSPRDSRGGRGRAVIFAALYVLGLITGLILAGL